MRSNKGKNLKTKADNLFERIKKDDEKALEDLFRYSFPRLFDFAHKITGNNAVAEDIIQDTYIKLWENRNSLTAGNIEALLFKMVRNQCINHVKYLKVVSEKKVKFQSLAKFEEMYRIDFIRDEPYILIEKELKEEIEKVINSLPDRCKEVFKLSRLEGLKNREIAEKLQINIKNVERHISRALSTFKQSLPKDFPLILIVLVLKYM